MIFKGYLQNKLVYCFIVIFFGITSQVFASVEIYGVMDVGSVLMNEESGGVEYSNKSSFFVGHWGYALGTRAKLNIGRLGLGLVGELAWIGDSLERKLNGVTHSSTYRNEFNRGLAGATASLNTGASSIFVEYYPWVQNSVIYSDLKEQNPFRKEDKLKATGYGVGFKFALTNESAYQLMYKNLQYRTFIINNLEVSLPNEQYQVMKLDEVSLGYVLSF
jgi:hypothetical protein